MRNVTHLGRIALLGLALGMGGCALVRHDPPSCDGRDRRPMNTGKWDQAPASLGGPCGNNQ